MFFCLLFCLLVFLVFFGFGCLVVFVVVVVCWCWLFCIWCCGGLCFGFLLGYVLVVGVWGDGGLEFGWVGGNFYCFFGCYFMGFFLGGIKWLLWFGVLGEGECVGKCSFLSWYFL